MKAENMDNNGCSQWTIVKRMDTFLCNLFLRAAA